MAKGFTPIIGLAVVVALAMVAVFGAMSLTPSPAEADGHVENLMVTNVDTGQIMLQWDGSGGDDEENYSARWYEKSIGGSGVRFTVGSTSAPFLVDVSDEDVVIATVGTPTGAEALFGRPYVVEVRSDTGDAAMVEATPAVRPITGQISIESAAVDDDDPGEVTLTWTRTTAAADPDNLSHWQYRVNPGTVVEDPEDTFTFTAATPVPDESDWMDFVEDVMVSVGNDGNADTADDVHTGTITGLESKAYRFEVRARNGDAREATTTVLFPATANTGAVNADTNPVAYMPPAAPAPPVEPSFVEGDPEPGKNTRYDLTFQVPNDTEVNTLTQELEIKLEDFGVPSSVDRSAIAISVKDTTPGAPGEDNQNRDFIPEDVTVSGEKLVITLGDMDASSDDVDYEIAGGSTIEVVIRQAAGVSNPSEAGGYGPEVVIKGVVELKWDAETTDADDNTSDTYPMLQITVPLIVELDEDDGGRGKAVEATGKGFKNGTTVTFWLDADNDQKKDDIESTLCDAVADGDDIATCGFTITNPPFVPGKGNFINGIDGEGGKALEDNTHDFELKASFTATPEGGSPGDTMLIQLQDFGDNASVTKATLAGTEICGVTGMPGCGNTLTIPNDTELGSLALKVWSDPDTSSTINVVITGPTITVTPTELVANQRVSLSGSGYTARSTIEVITIGSDDFEGFDRDATDTRTDVTVDSSGRWSASVNVPLVGGTVNGGSKTLRVTDAHGRSGTVDVTIKEPTVTIDPASGRVGTTVTIRGRNFPSTNDTSTPFNVSISYESARTISGTPNAGGSFDEQMEIPNTAIPGQSHNITVRIEEGVNHLRTITETHMVPAGELELSADSGVPGSTITVNGIGFKSFTQVTKATIGGTEVTPGVRPSTDGQGDFSFDILIPGLGIGIQTIEVALGTTTASIGFNVTASGVSSGNTTPVADAVTALGENFVRSFHFNNDTKTWTFYDPEAGDASTQENFIADETYWILVMENVDGVILNNKSRNLTCVGGNCWNQIVW